jgi:hypothetical protein
MVKMYVIDLIFYLIVSLMPAANAWAGPVITNISGAPSPGRTMTISGTSLKNEDSANWFYTTGSFEGANIAADGFSCRGGDCAYDKTVHLMGAQSFRSDAVSGGGATCGGSYSPWYGDHLSTGEHTGAHKFLRVYVWYGANMAEAFSGSYYIKNIYWLSGGIYLGWAYQYGWPTSIELKLNTTTEALDLPETWQPDKWYCLELEADHARSIARAWIDGVPLGSLNADFFQDKDPDRLEIGIINACGQDTVSGQAYYDGLAESTSRVHPAAMVILGNKADYAAATKVIQPLVNIAENSISFVYAESGYDPSGHTVKSMRGPERYVWVLDNRQTMSSPYKLIGGNNRAASAGAYGGIVHD